LGYKEKLFFLWEKKLQTSLRTQVLPLPKGTTEQDLRNFLCSVRVADASLPEETAKYCDDHFVRFVYTYDLIKDFKGKCLELGAAPYLMTMLLRQYAELELVLANYFGSNYERDCFDETILFVDPLTKVKKTAEVKSYHFNLEDKVFPFEDNKFDVILFCEIIEHLLNDPVGVLNEIKRVLKPNGVLILTTPNVNRLENLVKMISGLNIYDPYSGYGPYGRHNREYNIHELSLLLDYCGFTVDSMFTIDTNKHSIKRDIFSIQLRYFFRKRRLDLGQYIFVRAFNTGEARRKKPNFLYRSYPEEELDDIAIQLVKGDDIVREPFTALNREWYGLEEWDGVPTRWMGNDGILVVQSNKNRPAKLKLQALSFLRPRTIEIYVGDRLVESKIVPSSFTRISVIINLKNGINFIRFHVKERSERPYDIPELKSIDKRYLSIAFRNIKIEKSL
jgi:SAM-dependent methyltransferase